MNTAEDTELSAQRRAGKSEAAFRTISEVSEELDVPQHVLRFWESKFPQIKPLKRGGGRRYYRPEDLALLRRIRDLLYKDGYTIKGVQKLLREQGKAILEENGVDSVPDSSVKSDQAHADPLSSLELEEDVPEEEDDDIDPSDQLMPEDSAEDVSPSSVEVMAEAFETDARVCVCPEPQPPLSTEGGPIQASDRIELLAVLKELEDLRELLFTSRRGSEKS